MDRLFLDANILMEIIFQRNKAFECLEKMQSADRIFVSSLTVHICMYYLEKDLLDLIPDFREILTEMFILDLNSEIINSAFTIYNRDDFEDCLQVATCLENNISTFLTLDKNLAKRHKDKLEIILL